MRNLELDIAGIMQDPVTGYTNSQGVTFTSEVVNFVSDSGFRSRRDISVVAKYPDFLDDHPAISLEVYVDFESVGDFIVQFEISAVGDLEKITANGLLGLYQQGKAYVFCLYGDNYLCFKTIGNRVFVSDYGSKERAIDVLLKTGSDFVDYTKKHHF